MIFFQINFPRIWVVLSILLNLGKYLSVTLYVNELSEVSNHLVDLQDNLLYSRS